jgi:hypothetical protein
MVNDAVVQGLLSQTLILSKWKPALAFLPVETVIRHQQMEYYAALSAADKASDATVFIDYMLQALLSAMQEVVLAQRHQVGTKLAPSPDQQTVLDNMQGEMSLVELMSLLNRTDHTTPSLSRKL